MFLKKLKIRGKLTVSFSLIILYLAFVAIFGAIRISLINETGGNLYYKDMLPLETLEKFKAEYAETRRKVMVVTLYGSVGDMENVEAASNDLLKQYKAVQTALQTHINLLIKVGDTDLDAINDLSRAFNDDYWPIVESINKYAENGNIEKMMVEIQKGVVISNDILKGINDLYAFKMTSASLLTEEVSKIAGNAMFMLLLIGSIGAVVSLALGLYMGMSISKRINVLRDAAEKMARGDFSSELIVDSDDELGELSQKLSEMAKAVIDVTDSLDNYAEEFIGGNLGASLNSSGMNGVFKNLADKMNSVFSLNIDETRIFIKCIKSFSEGDFKADMNKLPGQKVIMNESIDAIKMMMKSVIGDIGGLAGAASSGDLSRRVEVGKYQGDWAELVEALNKLMGAVATPINEVERVLTKVAAGDFEDKITGDYQGNFLVIKNAVNNMVANVSSYISEIAAILTAIADNDLNQAIKREYVGKFAEIKDSLNSIINTFNIVIADISSASLQVAAGAHQISDSSILLAQGATEQAAAVEELSATIIAINENTSRNADNARTACDLSSHAKESAERGNKEMHRMLSAMEGIKGASNNISKIIKVIDDIAFQTNLLALNAAVEAAHAGTHGNGFTVVAEEVRNLAARSLNAAKETAALIEESIEKVDDGVRIADGTAVALQEIVSDAETVSGIVEGIAEASVKQAAAIAQVKDGLTQITEVVQNNSATSEESAAAAEELSSQSDTLNGIISVFNLKKIQR